MIMVETGFGWAEPSLAWRSIDLRGSEAKCRTASGNLPNISADPHISVGPAADGRPERARPSVLIDRVDRGGQSSLFATGLSALGL